MLDSPQMAERSLLLDYVSPNTVVLLWVSIRRRHFAVIITVVGSLLIISIAVVSTSLFVLQPVMVERNSTMSLTSQLDAASFNISQITSIPILAATTILSGNLSITYPPNTNDRYATESFQLLGPLAGKFLYHSVEPTNVCCSWA